MKIALVGPGIIQIPPPAWGAVEILIWDYYNELLKRGIDVHIINTKNLYEIINVINSNNFDFVHLHYDMHYKILPFLKCSIIAITSHYPYIDKIEKHKNDKYDGFFNFMIKQNQYYNFVLADKDKKMFLENGANENIIKKIKNGINSSLFHFEKEAKNNKTVYLGKITERKNQYLYQNIETIDFIGGCDDGKFNTNRKNYIGEWTRKKINDELTNYTNLLLLSQGEADPLVVKEALIAGLGVVINKSSSANIDINNDFITIIEDENINNIQYVLKKIEENKQISIRKREQIREYGIKTFDISKEVDNYLETINQIINNKK